MGRMPSAVFVVLLAVAPAVAAPPYTVCRSTDPARVAGTPLASTDLAPFDDTPGLLADGLSHYYLILDDKGRAADISVHKNEVSGTVRLGFDDGDGDPLGLDPIASTVSVVPSTIPADGVTQSTIAVVPRDVNGTPLGRGLGVSLDFAAMWPGNVDGPVVDRGDGSYSVSVSSPAAGVGIVWTTVEGIRLAAEPTITFALASGAPDLRELGILELEALTAAGGAFEQLMTDLDPADPGVATLASALHAAREALTELYLDDDDRDRRALDHLRLAVATLVAALDAPGAVSVEELEALIDDLLGVTRQLAQFHLDRAELACGVCQTSSSDSKKVCDATDALREGDLLRLLPEPEKAVKQYNKAVDRALSALAACG